jgi:methylase of polypeptide subunit release factors
VSWLHLLTISDVLSDVLEFREEMEIRWSQVRAVHWVVQDSETKAADLGSGSCACVRPS